jgi:hypothetical protein
MRVLRIEEMMEIEKTIADGMSPEELEEFVFDCHRHWNDYAKLHNQSEDSHWSEWYGMKAGLWQKLYNAYKLQLDKRRESEPYETKSYGHSNLDSFGNRFPPE